ncbi:hypothetical protein Z042_15905 [Chania multitudinisentens RB-25]|uniref:PRD domain-containing protein n=1 Tax=Chania multitudinisentens RB-25 TaxID=1441930 RepID=W0LEW5_9GAMM|nr:PRD domain-containing protein [Chania multitudinisentens]AHG20919.1 hypothetical protein Z042_15905 [Chania multitudinisentens RB-25]
MEQRLQILASANLISAEVHQGMLKVVNKLEQQWGLVIRNSQGQMAITHMANALMRCARGEPVAAMDNELFSEVVESELFERLQMINNDLLSEFSIQIPESEKTYLLSNLYALHLAQAD